MNALEKEYQWAKIKLRVKDMFASWSWLCFIGIYINQIVSNDTIFCLFVCLAISHLLWDLSSLWGIEPGPLAVNAPTPNHCTAREFPLQLLDLPFLRFISMDSSICSWFMATPMFYCIIIGQFSHCALDNHSGFL